MRGVGACVVDAFSSPSPSPLPSPQLLQVYNNIAISMLSSEWPRALLIGVSCQYDASQMWIDRRGIDLPSLWIRVIL